MLRAARQEAHWLRGFLRSQTRGHPGPRRSFLEIRVGYELIYDSLQEGCRAPRREIDALAAEQRSLAGAANACDPEAPKMSEWDCWKTSRRRC
jgi:hypothetical protein